MLNNNRLNNYMEQLNNIEAEMISIQNKFNIDSKSISIYIRMLPSTKRTNLILYTLLNK